jgi:hypothetical protein
MLIYYQYRLNNEFLSDPWITNHPRKLMASPKRWAWKNAREIKNQYAFTFYTNMAIGSILTAPFAIWVGRRAQRYQSGVPIVPHNKIVHDFVNLDPGHYTRKVFRKYFFVTCLLGGYMFATYTVSSNQKKNEWYTRPDFKPFPAMVPKE